MFRIFMHIADFVFGRDIIRAAYRNMAHGEKNKLGVPGVVVTILLLPLVLLPSFKRFLQRPEPVLIEPLMMFSRASLEQSTNSITHMPEVVVSPQRKKTINFLVPAFSMGTISAGFFGVFQIALMVAREGYNVRLVLFDSFKFDGQLFKESLQNYPGLEGLLDEVELTYIGDRYQPLLISPEDNAVATVWYSAYLARKIMSLLEGRPFLYLIQDYEAAFYPSNSLFAFADQTYAFNYYGMVSTKLLFDFMRQKEARFDQLVLQDRAVFFNNACSAALPEKQAFISKHKGKIKKFAFYSRPAVNRNMFELGALAIIEAWQTGVFNTGHNWEFYGIGIGNVEIQLDERLKITQLPRMSLAEYEDKIREFDLCLSLMASPHPSITPFDMAGVGAIAVTNSFANKDAHYFNDVSKNIVTAEPNLHSVVAAIATAVARIDDLDARHENAVQMNYPRDWQSVWKSEHKALVHDLFGAV